METTIVYWGYIGTMEKKMETTIVYWGYIGIVENKMETTITLNSGDRKAPNLACPGRSSIAPWNASKTWHPGCQ